MTLRFSLPARVAVSALTILLCGPASTVPAQGNAVATTGPSATPRPKQSFLRFWNLLPAPPKPVETPAPGQPAKAIESPKPTESATTPDPSKTGTSAGSDTYELVPTADPKGSAFQTATPMNYGAGYKVVVPGRYALSLYRGGDHDKVLKTFDVILKDQDYATVVVHPATEPTAPPEAELTMDMPDPEHPSDNYLTVRQCLVNARVIAGIGHTQVSEPLSFGGSHTFKDLPKGPVPVGLSIAMAGGRAERMTVEADFTYVHRSTILIIKDVYGRLRPRLFEDGPNSFVEEPPKTTPLPAPKPTPSLTPKPIATPTPPSR